MKRRLTDRDELQIARLLSTLRGEAPLVDVEGRVARHVRLLPAPSYALPLVSLRQFGWSAAGGLGAVAAGAIGIGVSLAPSGSWVVTFAFGALAGASRGLVRIVFERVIELAGQLSSRADSLGGAIAMAGQMALVACAAIVALTLLVVSHEARGRRIAK